MTTRQKIYDLAGPRVQARIDRARHAARLLPRVAPDLDGPGACSGWPDPHRACLVVSADLELAWAWRYANLFDDPLEAALRLAAQSRENVPALLETFRRFELPVTWAVVGHLFLDSCSAPGGRPHPEAERLPYFSNDLWTFPAGDWYEHDPCSGLSSDPAWYAPDLVDDIRAADERHEIGCHTFSHVDFSDDRCPPEVARFELEATLAAARSRGVEIETMVFPGNRAGNLAALRDAGFTGYRYHDRAHLDVPRRDAFGMLRIPGGLCWEKPVGWPVRPWVSALCRAVDAAIESGTLLHLWFHPSCEPVNVEEVFPAVLDHVASAGDALWRATMRDVVRRCAAR
ncbi:MAG: polysaccharide deacetylase family protein [Actinomycetota bacterium]|nr:polysaccharide deacetylase family protein [Actinomycetota bacterium]